MKSFLYISAIKVTPKKTVMKNTPFIMIALLFLFPGCKKEVKSDNPFFNEWETPFKVTRDGEAETLFHEFGHALHQLLSNTIYPGVSGTSVPRDFVELPSQIMEHWVLEPEVLKVYAKHYETGEVQEIRLTCILHSGEKNPGLMLCSRAEDLNNRFIRKQHINLN